MRRAAILLALFACSKGPSKAECKTQVDEMMAFLHGMDHSPMLVAVEGFDLAMRPDLPPFELHQAPVVDVKPKEMTYQGVTVSGDDLRERLDAAFKKIQEDFELGRVPRSVKPDDLLEIIFVIDQASSWQQVVTAADAAMKAGFIKARFVFAKTSAPVKGPPPSKIDAQLQAILGKDEGGNKATELAKIMSEVVKPCPAAIKVFGAVASEEGGDKAAFIIEGMGEAAIECKCAMDIPSVTAMMWAIAGNPHPTTTLPLVLAEDGAAVELPGTTTWRDAQKSLAPGTRARFVAK